MRCTYMGKPRVDNRTSGFYIMCAWCSQFFLCRGDSKCAWYSLQSYCKASELLECEKTQFYQRLAFAFTIPTIYETINGQKLELCVGGVRNYSDLNLYRSTKGLEKFSCFIGWRVRICSNQVLTGEGVKFSMEVSNIGELYRNVLDLFNNFNPAKEIHLMQTLSNTSLSESQLVIRNQYLNYW